MVTPQLKRPVWDMFSQGEFLHSPMVQRQLTVKHCFASSHSYDDHIVYDGGLGEFDFEKDLEVHNNVADFLKIESMAVEDHSGSGQESGLIFRLSTEMGLVLYNYGGCIIILLSLPIWNLPQAVFRKSGWMSLNSCLYTGPCLLKSLNTTVHRFRVNKYAFVADVEKAFMLVKLFEEVRWYVRFLWLEAGDPDKPIKVYRYSSIFFGGT